MPNRFSNLCGRPTVLTRIRTPQKLQLCFDHIQRRWNGGYKTYPEFAQNLDNLLAGCPVEIILLIADCLSMAERVLLSLSSKRLRVILTSYYDLSLRDLNQRLDFLLVLERDLPDLLTCRPCGWMYKWRTRQDMNYTCPRVCGSKYARHGSYSIFCQHSMRHLTVYREVVDLIARAHLRGSHHGLCASYFDHFCSGKAWIYPWSVQEHIEGKIIRDQLYVARSCTLTEDLSRFQEDPHHGFSFQACSHRLWTLAWRDLHSNPNWIRQQPLKYGTIRCVYCATDIRSEVLPLGDCGTLQVVVRVWQNYGRCLADRREVPEIFDLGLSRPGPSDMKRLLLRNLEHDFLAGKE